VTLQTVVNGARILKTSVELHPGDTVYFGLMSAELTTAFAKDPKRLASVINAPPNPVYTVSYIPLNVMLTLLSDPEKVNVINALGPIGKG
jgi:hypothetical protein